MRPRTVVLVLCAFPGLARAAAAPAALDLHGGAVGELTGKTLALAHGLLAFLLVLGLVRELLRGPGQRRHYLAVVWRALLVLGLLQGYGFLAGSVVKQCTSLPQMLAPSESVQGLLDKYRTAVGQSFGAGDAAAAAPPGAAAPVDDKRPGGVGGVLFDAVLALMLLLAQAVQWVFTQLSRLLIGFFYAIGPLALVFHVPGLDAPGRWLRHLVTVSCWPAVSALLLHLSASVLTQTNFTAGGAGTVFGAIASSVLLSAMAFATPRIASALVGGVGNLVTEGASAVMGVATGAVGGGALGAAVHGAVGAVAAGGRLVAPATSAVRGGFRPASRAASRPLQPRATGGHER
jgi:hypothetical protein